MEPLTLQKPHWEALTPDTRSALHLLNRLDVTRRFYLAGGTGLALHLGHRISVDLDFFCEEPDAVNPSERALLRQALDDPTFTITFDTDATFVGTWQGVGVSFFRLSLYPLILPTLNLEGIRLASIEEIGAMKLAAIIGQGARRDLVDLYYILQLVSLDDLFQVASQKYSKVRTFALSSVRGLAYFTDAEALPMPEMLDKTPWVKMKKCLELKAIEAGRKNLENLWG